MNGVEATGTAVSSTATLVALNGDKKNGAEDDGGRPKKRARTADSDEEIVEGTCLLLRSSLPPSSVTLLCGLD